MIDKYVFIKIKDHGGNLLICADCNSEVPVKLFRRQRVDNDGYKFLCEICAKSYIDSACEYPQQHTDPSLYQSIGTIGNLIRKDLKAFDDCATIWLTFDEVKQLRETGEIERDLTT